jgi:hypothetical protein
MRHDTFLIYLVCVPMGVGAHAIPTASGMRTSSAAWQESLKGWGLGFNRCGASEV